ncbi:MAG: hypothetical protein OHK0038_21270 [Flammeovirgaceae bacterium]
MKKHLALLLLISMIFFANAQSLKVVKVDNVNEFLDAIGSNKIIQLQGSPIMLSNVSPKKIGKNYRYSQEYDGHELVIFGVYNLKIVGVSTLPVKIITKPLYGDVIVFENCNNITIENVDAGHSPEKGQCTGGVFNFLNSKYITINNSIMYGSGIEGITAENVTKLTCNNSIIKECTYSIMSLQNCKQFEFNNCEFKNNQEFDLIKINNCKEIKYNLCLFSNNKTGNEQYDEYSLFNVVESSLVQLKNCIIINNTVPYFCNDENALEIKETELKNNIFTKGKFKN